MNDGGGVKEDAYTGVVDRRDEPERGTMAGVLSIRAGKWCIGLLACWCLTFGITPARAADGTHTLWYRAPADKWIQALPVGNGRFGAMIFGQPQKERLQLNDVTVWSGGPNPRADRQDAYKSLPQLRRLIREGKYKEAETFANAYFNGPAPYDASYQTLGDLNLDFQLPSGNVTGYRRYLDLSQALAGVTFKSGQTTFTREIFSSAPDQAIVHRISADGKGAVSFTMALSRVERATTRFVAPATLVMTGTTGDTLGYEVHARVVAAGGRVTGTSHGRLVVAGADEAVIVLTAATTFVPDYDAGYKGGDLSVVGKRAEAAAAKSYGALRTAHVADYRRFFDRVKLDLGKTDNTDRPTDERLKSYKDDRDPAFATLFYQFGRYLLISSSRPDNPLPSNSQGIWGDGLDLPWKCDYKANINYQMNYWAAEPSNLSEMHLPMLRMTQGLVKSGTKTAKAYFGPETPGWVVGYTTNGWGWTSPGKSLPWGIWFGGSAWMCQHLWEHYAFTRDREYLRSVYPTLKGAAEFWLANLIEGPDGKLIASPTSSPENTFTTDTGETSTITEGAAMESALVWELLDNTAQACAVLGIEPDFAAKAAAARDRIRKPQIGKAGQLMEWNGDWDLNAKDIQHRHISHLYPLHPGRQITVTGAPELAAAARKSLEIRGDDGTGWSLAWKINCWARLRDADRARRLMDYQLRYTEEVKTVMSRAGGTYPNLFDAHPPFQIDGNFGFVSGVNEMLVQSHERYVDSAAPNENRYFIDLLPAVPSGWSTGSVDGLRARGGFEISMRWEKGRLTAGRITNITSSPASGRVRVSGRVFDISLKPGESKELTSHSPR